jgi:hypothetical protein
MIKSPFPCYDPAMRLPILITLLLAAPAFAQTGATPDILHQRQQLIYAILTTDDQHAVDKQRWICINGQEPARVKDARAGGFAFTPDASDSCVAALQRSAKDSLLFGIYKRLLAGIGGDSSISQNFPKAIGSAVLSGNGQVPIGNGNAAKITPQMAFDAGFTVAYTDGAARKQGDPQKLKTLAEDCLNAQGDAGTCFSVGFVYGSQAFNAQ